MNLGEIFDEINLTHFDGFLERPTLVWNSRLRASAGRFFPGSRKYADRYPPKIEVASYLQEEAESQRHIKDTIAHEMIHYWLWVRRRPYGHTEEFWQKMTQMGVSRYNPVPRLRAYKYVYACPSCEREFPSRRKLGTLACLQCCKRHAHGRFDRRFVLLFKGDFVPVKTDSISV